ncbi:MAG: hypothetical protein K0M45_03995 [Candidatus Paracaedibacteraceae bacterium]|nr:hypothetical protein [Candidatus Paracaedibacteraceae bacterium]
MKKISCGQYQANRFKFPISKEDAEEYKLYIEHAGNCKTCVDWDIAQKIIERGANPNDFCCLIMGEKVTFSCDQHPDPWDCVDYTLVRTEKGNYGIPIRDGGSSYIRISFCPWCGTNLKKVKPIKVLNKKK